MRPRLAVRGLLLASIAALAACAHETPTPAPRPVARVEPKPSGLVWSYFGDRSEAKLAFGRPHSDTIAVLLSCRPHTGQAWVSGVDPQRTSLLFVSGREWTRVEGRTGRDPLTGSRWLAGKVPLDRGAFSGFGHSGRLILIAGGRSTSLSASGRDHRSVRRFFDACD